MSIISIGIPIPDRSALPGQTGDGNEVNLQYATQNYCDGTGIFTPTVATPAGGAFTDNSSDPNLFQVNSTTGAFNLGVSNPGNYIVTYTVAGVGSANFPINISALDDASFSYSASTFCADAPDQTPTITTPGGLFSQPTGLSINSSTGEINVAASTPGAYTITYTTNNCVNSSTQNVTINALPAVAISGALSYCNGSNTTLTATAGLSSYLWSTGAITQAINVTAGSYTVTGTDSNGCSATSSSVTVTELPLDDASFSYSANSYCQNAASNPTTTPATPGGTFSSTTGLSINSTTGEINLAASTVGNYVVTYNTPSGNACPNSSTQNVEVLAVDVASLSYPASSYPQSGTDPSPTFSPQNGGTFTATPSGLSINSSTGVIDLSASSVNSYTITYTSGGACPDTATFSLGIVSVDASFSYSTPICKFDSNPTPTVVTAGGTFTASPSGLTFANASTGEIDLSNTAVNTYTITYTVSGVSSTQSVEVEGATAIATVNNDATMTFNGTDQYIQLSSEVNHGTTNTLSFWINSSNTGTNYVFGANTNGGHLLKALNASDTVSYRTSAGARTFDLSGLSSNPMKDGDWHHIAFTRNSSNLIQLYVDGSSVGSAQSLSGNTLFEVIGANYAKSVFFDGKLDEVAIWNTALGPCDIKGIYDATTTVSGQPKTANLLDANTTIPTPVYWNRMGDS